MLRAGRPARIISAMGPPSPPHSWDGWWAHWSATQPLLVSREPRSLQQACVVLGARIDVLSSNPNQIVAPYVTSSVSGCLNKTSMVTSSDMAYHAKSTDCCLQHKLSQFSCRSIADKSASEFYLWFLGPCYKPGIREKKLVHVEFMSGILSEKHSDILSCISPGSLSGISPGILSGISPGLLSSISSDILCGILSDTLSGLSCCTSSDILSHNPSNILSGISSDIHVRRSSDNLSDILSGVSSDIPSDILSGISSDILPGTSIWQILCLAVEVR